MPDMNQLASALFGTTRAETKDYSAAVVQQATGTAVADSDDGRVTVVLDGADATTSDGSNRVELPTEADVRAGDSVSVRLSGEGVQVPTVTGVVGGGDRTREEVARVRADMEAADKESSDAIAAVKADMAATDKEIEDFKENAKATYYTKTEVDEKTGAITKTLEADYVKESDAETTYATKTALKASADELQASISSSYASVTKVTDAQQSKIDELSAVADAAIETWQYEGEPTATSAPAKDWTTDELRARHAGDIYYDTKTWHAWRWDGSAWQRIADTDVTKALAASSDNAAAIDTIKTTYTKDADFRATTDQITADVSAHYNELTTYKTSNDRAVSKAQTDATDAASAASVAQSTADSATSAASKAQGTADAVDKRLATVEKDYVTEATLTTTKDSIEGKVSDSLTEAKGYTDSSVEQEVTARNAAIKAQADSISLDVSRTYTKSETFSAYQSDADGRIATANANASTAVSTAKTAASDAATAKTNASTAVDTANAASSNASKAVSTANSAASTASTAKSTADAAKSSASTAVSTANAASSTAGTAKSTADAAQAKADDAWARTLRVEVMSAPADAAGDTSLLTAYAFRGGEQLSDEAVAKMGLLAWYVGGRRVATGSTYTCAAGTAAECRLEA